MKILITDSVNLDLLSIIKSEKNKKKFLLKIREKINLNWWKNIFLKRPFIKIKVNFLNISFRIIAENNIENNFVVLMLFFKKSDKNFWENLVWSDELEKKIKNQMIKIQSDLLFDKYELI